jgi:plasmid replication initiation protein
MVSKSNNLITASYSLGNIEQRLILCFLGNIDNNICKKAGKERDLLEVISADKWYSIDVRQYAELYNVSLKYAKEELEAAVQGLYDAEVTYLNEKGLEVTTRWVSSRVKYDKETCTIKLAWALGIIPYISQLRANFTSYHLQNIKTLTSSYSIRWYELFVMELNRSRKSSMLLTVAIEDIRVLFKLQDKYTLFADFMKRVVETPIKLINLDKNTNIKVSLVDEAGKRRYIKDGKRVISITFDISWKQKAAVVKYLNQP